MAEEIEKVVQQIINEAISEINKFPPQDSFKSSLFSLSWCFGQDNKPIHLNASKIFFPASHLGVLYDTQNQTQTFLPCLVNEITSACHNGQYLAIADSGISDTGIALWDWKKPQLLRYWQNVFATGTRLLNFSPSGQFLTAISHTPQPTIIRWDIKGLNKTTAHLKPGTPVHLTQTEQECVITYATTIILINWQNDEITEFQIPKNPSKLGLYQKSVFLNLDEKIATGTNAGKILMWTKEGNYEKTIFVKNSNICDLKIKEANIFIEFQDGSVEMFDQTLKFLHNFPKNEKCPTGKILAIQVNPQRPIFIAGDSIGNLTAYDYEKNTKEFSKPLITSSITCMQFSPSCLTLAIGSAVGDILLIDPILFTIEIILESTTNKITQILYACEEKIISVNSVNTIGYWKKCTSWTLCGKLQPHDLKIVGMVRNLNSIYTVSQDRKLAEMKFSERLNLVDSKKIEEIAIPTASVWYKNEIIVSNNNFRMRIIDPETKSIMRTVRSPGSSPVHIMAVNYSQEIIFAAGNEIGIWQNGSNIIAHADELLAITCSKNFIFTLGKNSSQVLKWTKNASTVSKPKMHFSKIIEKNIKLIFVNGVIEKNEICKNLQLLGYYPSNFDMENINREIESETIDEETFRKILWNHGPPPEISLKELKDAALSISEIQNSKPIIMTKRLIKILKSVQNLSHEESVKCLQNLFGPGHLPQKISLDEFIAILGI